MPSILRPTSILLAARRKTIRFLPLFLIYQAAAQTAVVLDPAKPLQEFEGWGVSLCWWANGVGRWSDANRGKVLKLIADPDSGLGYNLFRYNIGGGDRPGHAHMRQYGDIPGFRPTEAGAYDWEADPYQRRVAEGLQARGKGIIWEAFANSPPWWMTKSGCVGGNTDGSDNLKPDYFDDFADYLTEVARHFRDQWGISFRTVEPFNEPTARWWTGPDKNQEGCGFRDEQPRMVKLLGKSLKDKGLAISIAAADENSIAEAVTGIGKYDDSALAFLSRMNVHSYNGKQSRKAYAALGSKFRKGIWQSESGPLSWPGGNQMDVSLWMADVIIRDIREMRVNGWLDWQIIDGGVWGSLTVDYGQQTAIPNRRFYMHANFSRFIRPGSLILDSDQDSLLAALVPSSGSLAVVILNGNSGNRDYLLDLSRFTGVAASATAYRTSENENLVKLADLPVQGGKLAVRAPARSITTCVVRVTLPSAIRADAGHGAAVRDGPPFPLFRAAEGMMELILPGGGRHDAKGREYPPLPSGASPRR